jgi:hypothetical protein
MLRVRSGGDPSSEAPLPPEMGQVIAEARSEMDRLVGLGGLQNDPLRHPIQALSVHLGALHKLSLNNSQALAKQVEAARQSISDEDIRRLSQAAANGAERRAAELARSANWRTVTIATASVLALMCASAIGGWWWRGGPPDLTCRDLPNGSRVCFVFTRPPTQQEAAPSAPVAPVAPTQGPTVTNTPARH